MNEVMRAILERRSTRQYGPEPVTEAQLSAILEAGLWAPTARNAQEIRFAVLRDPALRKAFKADFLASGAKPRFADFDYSAPLFIFLSGPADFPYTEMDSGIAVENMALAAQGLGLGTVIIGCIRDFMRSPAAAPWRERLGIGPEDIFTIGLCVGHIGQPTPSQPRKEGRVRSL